MLNADQMTTLRAIHDKTPVPNGLRYAEATNALLEQGLVEYGADWTMQLTNAGHAALAS